MFFGVILLNTKVVISLFMCSVFSDRAWPFHVCIEILHKVFWILKNNAEILLTDEVFLFGRKFNYQLLLLTWEGLLVVLQCLLDQKVHMFLINEQWLLLFSLPIQNLESLLIFCRRPRLYLKLVLIAMWMA